MVIKKHFDSGLELNMSFDSKVYVLTDNSSTGKTYLFNILRRYFEEIGVDYSVIDFKDVLRVDFSDDYVVKQCQMYPIIALDNADLYMTPDLFSRIDNLGNTILISIKDEFLLRPFKVQSKLHSYEEVDLFFEDNKLEVL